MSHLCLKKKKESSILRCPHRKHLIVLSSSCSTVLSCIFKGFKGYCVKVLQSMAALSKCCHMPTMYFQLVSHPLTDEETPTLNNTS